MSTSSNIAIVSYQSPCGKLLLGAFDGRLCLCAWARELHPGRAQASLERRLGVGACEMASPVTTEAALQLDEYFAGNRVAFTVPLMLVGTEFQQEVWRQLMSVPYGHTVSYGRLAQLLGRSGASRAVANANGANPVSIFVPCHRVVGADGSLTGYAGGIDAKRFLLGVEGSASR
ncbi:methylated-DNA--[protein]-cysteine S-methyltransferase [Marseilla massiliensis]|uniref:methylated-DNA--[protein]-cysteine S-methyltransferase n=1 Tax=Marseilla massiliensis TaxID=1841864 RepID=UPI0020131E40|nr:methylated-DNA--[protein]-cysteine S-methyltransferase [Marseilla massiliensis]MCL1610758.1 methylated-DNA--[protein]-cysteine S-methyltransferase [Marseilla massiliensis]